MGITEQDRAGLDKSLKDLKLSNDEMDKFAKAFKDPEFMKLFEEYAKEVSDPKVKAETDAYLRQLEFEGRVEEVYGKGATLILPTPAFVIKTQNTADGSKVFINMCTSDKLDKASLKSAVDAKGNKGQHFDMPLCLGPKKTGTDKAGGACSVWDFVVHPDTHSMAAATPAIRKTMIETALEKIEESNEGVTLHRAVKEPKMKYKATEGCEKPHALAMRGPGSEAVNGRVKPVTAAAATAAAAVGGVAGPAAAASKAEAAAEPAPASAGARSKFAFPGPKGGAPAAAAAAAPAKPAAVLEPTQAGYVHDGGEVTPKWEVVHRGQIDLTEAWGDAGRGMAINTTHPKELVIRVQLPGVTSASAAQLDVSRCDVSVVVPGRFRLAAGLPFPVNSDLGRAKFDKAKQQLEVTVPVLAPPAPPARAVVTEIPGPAADEQSGDGDAAAASSRGDEAEVEGVLASGEAAGSAAGKEVEAGTATAAAAPDAAVAKAEAAAAVSDNQRKWAELHASAVGGSSSSQGGEEAFIATKALAEDGAGAASDEFQPSGRFAGARAGFVFRMGPQGLGYYRDRRQAAASAPAATTTAAAAPSTSSDKAVVAASSVRLQPRLNANLVADLD